MGIIGICLSLALLMFFAYKGVNVLFLAPVMALVAVLFHTDVPLMASYTQVFMPALGQYLLTYFPIFMLGSLFGKFMSDSGYASIIGHFIAKKLGEKHAILAIVLSCAVLTYGGVSLFVVAFCIYPIARTLFKTAQIPKRLIPGSIALGSFTFTMTALPGTPAIQNAIPMPYFGTTAFAAPTLGIIGSVIMFTLGLIYLNMRARKAKLSGEGYLPEGQTEPDSDVKSKKNPKTSDVVTAFMPLVVVLALNYGLSTYALPQMSAEYLSLPEYGKTQLSKVMGLWSLIGSIVVGLFILIVVSWRSLKDPVKTLNEGALGSMLPIFNTASEVGYGKVIAFLPSFAIIKNSVLSLWPDQPVISEAIAVNILAGITGSASGGLSIALEALGKNYLELAQQANISPEVLHRVASMSSGGLDTLPHNGAVITLLAICGLTHKTSYLDIFFVAVVFPLIATVAVVAIA